MKKLLSLIAIIAAFAFVVPKQAEAQNNSYVVSHLFDSDGAYFKIDTLVGKAPVFAVLHDSITDLWLSQKVVLADSLKATTTTTNVLDEIWLTSLFWNQKDKPFGILPEGYFYRIKAAGKLYYPSRYDKLIFYYKP